MRSLLTVTLLLSSALQNLPWLRLAVTVDRVKDGNSLRVIDRTGYVHHVRLAGIDVPDLGQAKGVVARDRLRELVAGKKVTMCHRFVDLAGRTLAHVYVENVWVNRVLVEEGLAWHLDPHGECRQLRAVEAYARDRRVGIWEAEKPVPPWHWRRGRYVWREGMAEEKPHVYPRHPSSNEPRGVAVPPR